MVSTFNLAARLSRFLKWMLPIIPSVSIPGFLRDLFGEANVALLKEWLSPEQREQYESQKTFEVVGGDTGTRYRIRPPGAYNISVLDSNGGTASNICVVPKDMTALGDILLAQKVALERNERATLKVANRKPEFVGIDRSFANMSMVSGVIQNRQLF